MTVSAWLFILFSFLCAIILMVVPMAPWLTDIAPIWIIPLIIYWVMALPHRLGIFAIWCSGLILDILFNSLLGAHALTLLIVVSLFYNLSRRFSFFSTLQQIIVIMFFTTLYLAILTLIQMLSGQPPSPSFWPILTTGLIWPMVSALLRHYRQRFRMT